MHLIKKTPFWLLTGILYGLSWPIFEEINLSFLAWFAFVPLFIFLEKNQHKFWKSIIGSYGSMVVFGCFSASWLFKFPQEKYQVAILFFLEEFWFFIPFLIFFFIQKKILFDKALWLFPFIWMVWEWIYLNLEFTMGTHLSAYSQSNNIWLIQFIDFTGMWGVSFWLMLFNVLVFKAYKQHYTNFFNKLVFKKMVIISILMLSIPLIYGAFSYTRYRNTKGKTINITVIPTKYSPRYLLNPNTQYTIVEQTLHRTDEFAYNLKTKNTFSDLYVWPETGLPFKMEQTNLSNLLSESVKDWKGALITGARGVSDTTNTNDQRVYVSGVLISHKKIVPSFHHKTVLTPGQEVIPYHSLLAKLPKFPIEETDTRYFKKGEDSKPLVLTTKNNKHFSVGVSLCYEQWFPKHWAALSRNGADFYVHIAAEGWYGNAGFSRFMANVTRMRCIENRKQAARSANIGVSGFIDQMGNYIKKSNITSIQPIQASLTSLHTITFYTKHPNWFPKLGLSVFLISLLFQYFKIKN